MSNKDASNLIVANCFKIFYLDEEYEVETYGI
jgi:hypothetical protein